MYFVNLFPSLFRLFPLLLYTGDKSGATRIVPARNWRSARGKTFYRICQSRLANVFNQNVSSNRSAV